MNFKQNALVYLAGPYTIPDPVTNTRIAMEKATELRDLGFPTYVPHLAILWDMAHPTDYDTWLNMCFEFIKACNYIYRLPGPSSGADKELVLASTLEIPVVYSTMELLERYNNGKN